MDVTERLGMQITSCADLDQQLIADTGLTALYLWGENCFNCGLFKAQAELHISRLQGLGLRWLHANVYEDTVLARRFSLHGVPAFYFFRGQRKLGRITGWPGVDAFCRAVQGLNSAH